MATAVSVVFIMLAVSIFFIMLLQDAETFQLAFEKQTNAKNNKRTFATDNEVCPEGFEWSHVKGMCLDCGQGYYRSWCMSACEKCAEPTTFYERLLRNCTVTRNSIVACKDDADAAAGLCTPSDAVQSDCDRATDLPATSTARTPPRTGTTLQAATTAPTSTASERTTGAFRSSLPFSTGLKSLTPSEVQEPLSKSSSPGLTTVGEQNEKEKARGNHYMFVAVYLSTVVTTIAMMAAVPFIPRLVQTTH